MTAVLILRVRSWFACSRRITSVFRAASRVTALRGEFRSCSRGCASWWFSPLVHGRARLPSRDFIVVDVAVVVVVIVIVIGMSVYVSLSLSLVGRCRCRFHWCVGVVVVVVVVMSVSLSLALSFVCWC